MMSKVADITCEGKSAKNKVRKSNFWMIEFTGRRSMKEKENSAKDSKTPEDMTSEYQVPHLVPLENLKKVGLGICIIGIAGTIAFCQPNTRNMTDHTLQVMRLAAILLYCAGSVIGGVVASSISLSNTVTNRWNVILKYTVLFGALLGMAGYAMTVAFILVRN